MGYIGAIYLLCSSDYHRKSKKQHELINMLKNSSETGIQMYSDSNNKVSLTMDVDFETIKFQDGIGMWTRDYYKSNPLCKFQVLIGKRM